MGIWMEGIFLLKSILRDIAGSHDDTCLCFTPPFLAQFHLEMLQFTPCPDGEIGRHKRFKISRQKWRTGSIPVPGTMENIAKSHLAVAFCLLLVDDYSPRAAMPAFAICASSIDLTPDTPTAPIHWPLTMMGTPPSSMPSICGALRNE